MPRGFTFTTVSKTNLAWHPELGEGYCDWLWLDGWTDSGYWYGLTMAFRLDQAAPLVGAEKRDWPLVQCLVIPPEGETQLLTEAFPVEKFKAEEPWGVTIGHNVLKGTLTPEGLPAGYSVKVAVDDVGIDLNAKSVALGMQFVEAEHGYTYYHPVKKIGVGWWPLVSRADIEGTLTFHGKEIKVNNGAGYIERQLFNSTFAGIMAHHFWGHAFAGDYTAVWTESAGPEQSQYRHFHPFVLYKGSDPIVSTHNLTLQPERFVLDEITKMPFPLVQTLQAVDGSTEVMVTLLPGNIAERHSLVDTPGTPYTAENPGGYIRQVCNAKIQIRRWDRIEEVMGVAQHEFGWWSQWFPLPPRE